MIFNHLFTDTYRFNYINPFTLRSNQQALQFPSIQDKLLI